MVAIKWTQKSKSDLKNIYDYIAFDSKFYAKKQYLSLNRKPLFYENMHHMVK